MRPVIWLTLLGAAAVLAFMAFTIHASGPPGSWTGGSVHILAAMVLAVAGVAALGGGLMWLAFFSARRGFDDRADFRDDDLF